MHVVHVAEETKNEILYGAVGIMFSVEDYNAKLTYAEQAIVDSFFESLDLSDQNDPLISMLNFGYLMNMVDTDNRWVYKGSLTTPPCTRYIYWNVLNTIYPISKKHLDQFKAQLNRGEDGNLDERGNWRDVTPVDTHGVVRVADSKFGTEMSTSNAASYNININIYNSGKGGMW